MNRRHACRVRRASIGVLRCAVILDASVGPATVGSGDQRPDEFRPLVNAQPPSAVLGIAFSPDGRQVALACHDTTILIHDVASFEHRATLRGHSERVWTVAFSPDGKTLASGSGEYRTPTDPGQFKLWDVATGKERLSSNGQAGLIFKVAFAPDGKTVASGSWDGTVKFWDLASGQEIGTLPGHKAAVRDVAWSPDGSTIATAGYDGTVVLWNATNLRRLKTIPAHSAGLQAVSFDPTGRLLVTCNRPSSMCEVKLFDLATSRELVCWPNLVTKSALAIDFSPDGHTLAVSGGNSTVVGDVRLIEVASGQVRADVRGHREWVEAVRFSPDGQLLASGSGNSRDKSGEFRLWRLADMHDTQAVRDSRSPQDLIPQWDALASSDSAHAYRAIRTLAAAPDQLVVALLKERLRPVPTSDAATIARLVADLDSDFFTTRQRATAELDRLGDVARPALEKALAATSNPEMRTRIEGLLKQVDYRLTSPPLLRGLRGVEVLGHLGTAAARALLDDLAKGAADASQIRAARAALDRLVRP